MKRLVLGLGAAAALTAVSSAVLAEDNGPHYSYVGANWVEFDIDGPKGSGIELIGGLGLGDYFHLQGKYQIGETDDRFVGGGTIDKIELTQYEVSVGAHAPLSDYTDFFIEVGLFEAEAELGSNTGKSDGELIRAGLRGMLSENFEVSANALRQLADNANDTGLEIGLTGYAGENLAIRFAFQDIDDTEFLKFGIGLAFK